MSAKFWLVTTRGGHRHYVTGDRADEGRWTKFKDRARTFTAEEAKFAKGKSQAEIIPASLARVHKPATCQAIKGGGKCTCK